MLEDIAADESAAADDEAPVRISLSFYVHSSIAPRQIVLHGSRPQKPGVVAAFSARVQVSFRSPWRLPVLAPPRASAAFARAPACTRHISRCPGEAVHPPAYRLPKRESRRSRRPRAFR